MEEEITGSRVTRSLRKRLSSTDREGSPVIATSKNDGSTLVKSTSQLGAITEQDLTSESEDTEVKKTPKIVHTRARTSSTLTEANVQLLSSPARRLTRRNSGAMEPSTPTPVRRSTRASSITSDDVSVKSNVAIKTRRTINIDKTLKEEDEKTPDTPRSTRSTVISPVPVKVSSTPITKATQEKQTVSLLLSSPTTPTKQDTTENPNTTQTKELTATPSSSIKNVSAGKYNLLPSLKISKIDMTEYLSPVINDSDGKIEVDDSFQSITSSEASNEITIGSKHLEPPVAELINFDESTPVTNKESRSVLSSTAPIYPSTPKTEKKTLDLNDKDKSDDPQTAVKQPEPKSSENESLKSDNDSLGTEFNGSSSQLDPKTPTKKFMESDVNKSVTQIDIISQQQLDSKTQTKNVDSIAKKSVGTENCENASPQPTSKTTTKNLEDDVNKSVATKHSSESDAYKPIKKENGECSSPQLGPKTPVKSLKPKMDNLFESETLNKLQHSHIDLDGTDQESPMLNVKQRTPLKKIVSRPSSSTPIITEIVATEKSKILPRQDPEKISGIEKKELRSGSPAFSRSWSRSVVGKAVDFIDGLARLKEPEEKVIKSTNVSVSSRKSNKSIDDTFDETEEEVDNLKEVARDVVEGFINDEAEEAEEGDEDSMDEEEKQYIRDNEIPERDISLGSDDSSAGDDIEGSASSMDSFIVSDSDPDLLDGTGDDLSLEPTVMKENSLRKSHRIIDTSDEDEAKTQEISITYTHTKTITTEMRKTTNMIDEGAANKADKLDISVDERPPKAGMSKSFVESKTPIKTTKVNKSVGHEHFNVSDLEKDSCSTNHLDASVVNKSNSASSVDKPLDDPKTTTPSKEKAKAGLSKSLVEPKFSKKHLKLNKSVDVSSNKLNEPVGKRESSIKVLKDDKHDSQALQDSADDINASSETSQIEHVASPVPGKKRKRSIKTNEGEVESTPPFAKSPINSVKKKPNFDEIMGRCDTILKKALEAKLEQKLQNKNPIADDKVQKLKSKKEQKQLAKARRAAALIEIQTEAIEKAKKKRLKKEARALQKLENPEDDKSEAVVKAINHGISLLAKKVHLPVTIDDSSVVPDEPVQKKSKKRKLSTNVDEIATKKQSKSIAPAIAVIKQGQAKRKQEPPAQDIDADPVSHGTLKKRKLPQLLQYNETTEPSTLVNKNTNVTRFEQPDDVIISPQKKIKKLNILMLKPENNLKPFVVGKPKVFDANVLKITPKPAGFKEHSQSSAGQNDKNPKQKKKKEIVERVTVLPKPQWTASGAFEVSALSTNTENNDILRFSSATDFVVASLKPKTHKVKSTATEFKQRAFFDNSIKRESSKQLLQRKEKQMAYTRF